MPNLQKLNNSKEHILRTIRMKGPSLPVQIAKTLETSPLFASAFLSELYSDKSIKISNMKVGNSPLYFVEGQEKQLEKFVQYLNEREKEAYYLLKEKGILNDLKQLPVMRVALRAIKDFAIPMRVRINEEVKLFWKFFQLSDEDLKDKIQDILGIPKERREREKKEKEEKKKLEEKEAPKPKEKPKVEEIQKQTQEKETPKLKPVKKIESEFIDSIKAHLLEKEIQLLESISEKKKEFISKIRIDTLFGKQEYLLFAKDKKRINENDLNLAIQKAQTEKMPAIFISHGELEKSASEHLKQWKNLLKFEKLKEKDG